METIMLLGIILYKGHYEDPFPRSSIISSKFFRTLLRGMFALQGSLGSNTPKPFSLNPRR